MDLDIVRIQDVGLPGADGPTLLEWAVAEGVPRVESRAIALTTLMEGPSMVMQLVMEVRQEVPIHGGIAIAAAELPTFHGDPADRMLVASALDLGAELITADDRILDWRAGLRTRDARR